MFLNLAVRYTPSARADTALKDRALKDRALKDHVLKNHAQKDCPLKNCAPAPEFGQGEEAHAMRADTPLV
ncbi:hypothetical protein BJB45_03380 [Halomonas huangheensis]|uniref:Uncharacterized protein n=1 Tax=Halomonas huangheensis TaxID=1178482 RepID=W1N3P3_9GAMM|nr:hypothetical protein AR456_04860 [Halomonas huangheensis]ERL50182.1 hypothetical protein BJB45_03380 [Halomonas huangheensis]